MANTLKYLRFFTCNSLPPNELRDLIYMALKEGFQIHPDVIRLVEEEPELTSKVIDAISLKKAKSAGDPVIRISDLQLKEPEMAFDRTNLVVNDEYSFSDRISLGSFEDVATLFNNRLLRLREIFSQRPERITFVPVSQITGKKFTGERWVSGIVMERGEGYISVDDGKGPARISVKDRRVYDEAVPGIMLGIKVIYEDGPVAAEAADVEFPDIKWRRVRAKLAVVSGIGAWMNGYERIAEGIKKLRVDGVIFLGNLAYVKGAVMQGKGLVDAYSALGELLKEIPRRTLKVIVPGQTDATNLALPQKPLGYRLVKGMEGVTNLRSLGNPSMINLSGINVLLYYDLGYVKNSANPEVAIKKALKSRVIVPYLGVAPLLPLSVDRLIIENVPGIFIVGGVQKEVDIMYRGVWALGVPDVRTSGRVAVLDLSEIKAEWVEV